MWSRHRIDIGWSDLWAGLWHCCFSSRVESAAERLESAWSPDHDGIACLSVRTGLDLLLSESRWPAGSEILYSAITVPDMLRIVEHHGFVPVPLDLDPRTLAPTADAIHQAVTRNTKAIVVAHLFGRRLALDALIDAAKSHGLIVIEDCAQAFAGQEFRGHARADASLFSFGPIKTATALGGALLRVADPSLLSAMRERQAAYRRQSRGPYFRRVVKTGVLKFVALRFINGLLIQACRLFGKSYDELIGKASRGFAEEFEIAHFREQPAASLFRLLHRRLRRFSPRRLNRRAELGQRLRERLAGAIECPGDAPGYHDHWVFPVLADDPQQLSQRLLRAGFDSARPASMCAVDPPADRPELEPSAARDLLKRIVFVPMYPELTNRTIDRLAAALIER